MTRQRIDAQAAVGALVLAAHAALFWLWPRTTLVEQRAAESHSVAVTMVSIAPPSPSRAVAEPSALPAPASVPPAPSTGRTPRSAAPRDPLASPRPAAPNVRTTEGTIAPAAPLAAAAPEPAASALDLHLRLAPGQAQRGGLTEPVGSIRAQALNDPRSNVQPDPRQQLPDAVAAAGKGDCLKGEFAGGGMGLLSLPFLAYHAAAGNCRR